MKLSRPTSFVLTACVLIVGCDAGVPAQGSTAPEGAQTAATTTTPASTAVNAAVPEAGACLAAGEGWAAFPPDAPHLACCAGLVATEQYERSSREKEHRCLVSKGGRANCIACGDGVCGPGENFCNCPKDCGT